MHLARRIDRIEPSITLALAARARALAASGRDIVSMAVGEPDFPAPAIVRETAAERARSGDVRYTPAAGLPSLRAALAAYLERTRGGAWQAESVTVCHSAKHALAASILSIVEDGDEVLIPLPAWASYFDLVRLAGAEPVLVPSPCDAAGFHPDLDALSAACTPRTRAILINSPNNPSGTVWSRGEIEAVANLAAERDLWLISDEIYRELCYDGVEAASPASISPAVRERTIVIDGASKAFAMTGYRIGYLAAPPEFAAAVAKLSSQTNGSPNTIAQVCYERALTEWPPELETMRSAFSERRTLLLGGLAELGLFTPEPAGAFYAFPEITPYLGDFADSGSTGFCEALLEAEGLALVPGSAFGTDTHVRLSYATSTENIEEALGRLATFLGK